MLTTTIGAGFLITLLRRLLFPLFELSDEAISLPMSTSATASASVLIYASAFVFKLVASTVQRDTIEAITRLRNMVIVIFYDLITMDPRALAFYKIYATLGTGFSIIS